MSRLLNKWKKIYDLVPFHCCQKLKPRVVWKGNLSKKSNHKQNQSVFSQLSGFFFWRQFANDYYPRPPVLWLICLSLGFVEQLRSETPANMDKQVLGMPIWDWPLTAHTGPEGLESSPQSWLDIRKTCPRHQKLLEIFAEGHASTQSAAHLTLMEQVPYRWHCHQPFNYPYSAQMQNSIVPVSARMCMSWVSCFYEISVIRMPEESVWRNV